jgi:hypothetical protein
MKLSLLYTFLALSLSISSLAQTGKISGTVTDARTGEPLIGANIIIPETAIGAATDINGFYSIINVPPGTHSIRVSSIGYTTQTVVDIRVSINQTTIVDVELTEETIETDEVVIVATRPVVQQDISASTVSISIGEVANLPVVSVASIIGLQAGVQGLTFRGGGSDQLAFLVNGVTLRDERDNTPYTGISFTSIEEVQIQTGGFNAEYGNIRSGLVNVVTKEGKKDMYSVSFLGRYRPAGKKFFGNPPHHPDSYWIRPYIDPAVAWTGMDNGAWDEWTRRQYHEFLGGWNRVSESLQNDADPTNDLTPEEAQRLFLWQHRRDLNVSDFDFDADLSITGPVPGGEILGNLRFAAAYRETREMYFIPLSDDAYRDYNYQLKLTSDIQQGMKLSLEGLLGRQSGTNSSRAGGPGLFRSPGGIADDIDFRSGASFLDSRVFATDYWNPAKIKHNMVGAKLTHVLNPQTFYEVTMSRVEFKYDTNPGQPRYYYTYDENGNITGFSSNTDTSKGIFIGGKFFDMAPFGYYSGTSSGIGSTMNMGLGFSNSRDSSKLASYNLKFDLASQFDKYNYVKAGVEFTYTRNNVNYALVEPSLPSNNTKSVWDTEPIRAAVYLQDKLEFEGMIANLGLRLDYSDPGGEWYELSQFDRALSGAFSLGLDTLVARTAPDKQLFLSPRLGVAFPITVNSKLYFNYGHFRSMPIPEQLFLVRRSEVNNQVIRIANPNNPLPRTIAYELGYEHNLFDMLLLRVAGYYKDVTNQPRLVRYESRDLSVNYQIPEPNFYEDIRGFEITMTKNRGDWVRGFINYTYMVTTSGFFGLPRYSENPATQREIERTTANFYQNKPVPRPYARANIDFFTPRSFGPELGGFHIFEDMVLNLLASYSAGVYFSWTGPGATAPGFQNNIQWADFYNVDMRFSKGFSFGPVRFELFMDVNNVFNIRYMQYQAGFVDRNDFDDYMTSLHLPDDIAGQFNYGNIPGNDKPGDYRKPDAEFVPIVSVTDISQVSNPHTRPLYYESGSGRYMQYVNGQWAAADQGRVNQVLEDKAYIDMPNLDYTTFLNPRNIYWGLKFSLEL